MQLRISRIYLGEACVIMVAGLSAFVGSRLPSQSRMSVALDRLTALRTVNTRANVTTYRGKNAVHLMPSSEQENSKSDSVNTMAVLKVTDFKDGTIDADVAGAPRPVAAESARGFVGIAFRLQPDDETYECFYLRPTNGRAEDQLRRNHSTQYISAPEFPWYRLREQNPGVYESYVDLEPGSWTHMKIVAEGSKARLFVNGSQQPTLIVNDLKRGNSHGKIALWIGSDTDAYFANVTVTPR
jgi:hypothetical protein